MLGTSAFTATSKATRGLRSCLPQTIKWNASRAETISALETKLHSIGPGHPWHRRAREEALSELAALRRSNEEVIARLREVVDTSEAWGASIRTRAATALADRSTAPYVPHTPYTTQSSTRTPNSCSKCGTSLLSPVNSVGQSTLGTLSNGEKTNLQNPSSAIVESSASRPWLKRVVDRWKGVRDRPSSCSRPITDRWTAATKSKSSWKSQSSQRSLLSSLSSTSPSVSSASSAPSYPSFSSSKYSTSSKVSYPSAPKSSSPSVPSATSTRENASHLLGGRLRQAWNSVSSRCKSNWPKPSTAIGSTSFSQSIAHA